MDPSRPSRAAGSYVRDALGVGLGLRASLGVDPFALGLVGSSDTHNSASPLVESTYFGKLGLADGTPAIRLGDPDRSGRAGAGIAWSSAGLAGVWATANTRAALFDAIRRRETFATTGPRIRVRLTARLDAEEVAMGGELALRPGKAAPRFRIVAQQDPLEAPLERVQIVKLASRAGARSERIFDVACAGGDRPDPATARCPHAAPAPDPTDCAVPAGHGARELEAEFSDPDFERDAHALYYARVLQVPTCRWSSFDALRLARTPPEGVPPTIQERAVTSPIWIAPEKRSR